MLLPFGRVVGGWEDGSDVGEIGGGGWTLFFWPAGAGGGGGPRAPLPFRGGAGEGEGSEARTVK